MGKKTKEKENSFFPFFLLLSYDVRIIIIPVYIGPIQ
jgi:hypothetical protein